MFGEAGARLSRPAPRRARRRCLLGRTRCSDADPRPVHDRWAEVSERTRDFFRTTTLAELRIPRDTAGTPGQPERPDSS